MDCEKCKWKYPETCRACKAEQEEHRLKQELEMVEAGANFQHAKQELESAELALRHSILQQEILRLHNTTEYNVLFVLADRYQNENPFN